MFAAARAERDRALAQGQSVAVRDWFVVEIAFASGLRVSELAQLVFADLVLRTPAVIVVRRGKGGRARIVTVSSKFRTAAEQYLAWRAERGELPDLKAPVFLSCVTGRAMSTRAIQLSFERSLRKAGVEHRGIHCARHTFATELYRCSRNLRLVQQQLGHSSLVTTQVYLSVVAADVHEAMERLYGESVVNEGAA